MHEPNTIGVLIADDHSILREGVRALVEAEPGLSVVGEARDGAEAWKRARELKPDVLVLDLSLPGMTGLEALQHIAHDSPDVKVLVLTGHEEHGHFPSLMEAGAAGYLLKRSTWSELVRAIRAVAAGERYVDASLAATLLDHRRISSRHRPPEMGSGVTLTAREGEVLRLLARGYGNKEVAAALSISVKTVETHRASGMARLGIRSRATLVQFALIEGWLRADG